MNDPSRGGFTLRTPRALPLCWEWRGAGISTEVQIDPQTGRVMSRTFYDENGRSFARQDYTHTHKVNGIDTRPHEHTQRFNAAGQPITSERTTALPTGYPDTPTPR